MVILGIAESTSLKQLGVPKTRLILMSNDPDDYARELYAALHEADGPDVGAIWIELPPDFPAWIAVGDRIVRATRVL